jgi:hypothetical protein
MKTRKFIVTGLVLILLALAVPTTSRVAAFRLPAHTVVSGNNQIFYSPSIENMVNRGHESQVTNQVFYSPSIEGFVNRSRTSQITNQVFYSPITEGFVNRGSKSQITNQIFYSPTIESFVH